MLAAASRRTVGGLKRRLSFRLGRRAGEDGDRGSGFRKSPLFTSLLNVVEKYIGPSRLTSGTQKQDGMQPGELKKKASDKVGRTSPDGSGGMLSQGLLPRQAGETEVDVTRQLGARERAMHIEGAAAPKLRRASSNIFLDDIELVRKTAQLVETDTEVPVGVLFSIMDLLCLYRSWDLESWLPSLQALEKRTSPHIAADVARRILQGIDHAAAELSGENVLRRSYEAKKKALDGRVDQHAFAKATAVAQLEREFALSLHDVRKRADGDALRRELLTALSSSIEFLGASAPATAAHLILQLLESMTSSHRLKADALADIAWFVSRSPTASEGAAVRTLEELQLQMEARGFQNVAAFRERCAEGASRAACVDALRFPRPSVRSLRELGAMARAIAAGREPADDSQVTGFLARLKHECRRKALKRRGRRPSLCGLLRVLDDCVPFQRALNDYPGAVALLKLLRRRGRRGRGRNGRLAPLLTAGFQYLAASCPPERRAEVERALTRAARGGGGELRRAVRALRRHRRAMRDAASLAPAPDGVPGRLAAPPRRLRTGSIKELEAAFGDGKGRRESGRPDPVLKPKTGAEKGGSPTEQGKDNTRREGGRGAETGDTLHGLCTKPGEAPAVDFPLYDAKLLVAMQRFATDERLRAVVKARLLLPEPPLRPRTGVPLAWLCWQRFDSLAPSVLKALDRPFFRGLCAGVPIPAKPAFPADAALALFARAHAAVFNETRSPDGILDLITSTPLTAAVHRFKMLFPHPLALIAHGDSYRLFLKILDGIEGRGRRLATCANMTAKGAPTLTPEALIDGLDAVLGDLAEPPKGSVFWRALPCIVEAATSLEGMHLTFSKPALKADAGPAQIEKLKDLRVEDGVARVADLARVLQTEFVRFTVLRGLSDSARAKPADFVIVAPQRGRRKVKVVNATARERISLMDAVLNKPIPGVFARTRASFAAQKALMGSNENALDSSGNLAPDLVPKR